MGKPNELFCQLKTYVCLYVCVTIYVSIHLCMYVCIKKIGHDWAHMQVSIYWLVSLYISHFSFDLHPLILPLTCLSDSLVANPDGWILTSYMYLVIFVPTIYKSSPFGRRFSTEKPRGLLVSLHFLDHTYWLQLVHEKEDLGGHNQQWTHWKMQMQNTVWVP